MRSYQQIYEELAKYFTRGDFAVETVPALLSLPPQIRSGFCLQTRRSIFGSVCPMKYKLERELREYCVNCLKI